MKTQHKYAVVPSLVLMLLFMFSQKGLATGLPGDTLKSGSKSTSAPKTGSKAPATNGIYLGAGLGLGNINVYRNYKDNPSRLAFNARIYAEFSSAIRFVGEYTWYPSFDITPTWYNIHAMNADLNAHFMFHSGDFNGLFYGLLGLDYHRWSGFFTGEKDFNSLSNYYTPGREQHNNFWGMNTGVGFEYQLKHFQLFAEYRFRFSDTDQGFGISDVTANLGAKFRIPNFRLNLKKIFRNPNDKYHWF